MLRVYGGLLHDEDIPHRRPLRYRLYHEASHLFGGEIFEGMYGDIGMPAQQGFLDLLGEEPLALDLVETEVLNLITPGLENDNLGGPF